MEAKIRELMDFLDGAHSVYHAVAGLVWELEAAGYTCLSESAQWNLQAGGKYYLTTLKNDKTRTICVAPTVMELLRQRKEFQEWERIAAHTAWFEDIPGLVFETPTGKHLSHTTVRNNFKKVVLKSKKK